MFDGYVYKEIHFSGDSGYPRRPWLMTPILNAAQGSREELYTQRHVQARNCIERCFGLLKERWRCLLKDRVLHYHPSVASKIITACCVLHNMSLTPHLQLSISTDNGDDNINATQTSTASTSITTNSQNDLIQGRAMLNCLISNLQ